MSPISLVRCGDSAALDRSITTVEIDLFSTLCLFFFLCLLCF